MYACMRDRETTIAGGCESGGGVKSKTSGEGGEEGKRNLLKIEGDEKRRGEG